MTRGPVLVVLAIVNVPVYWVLYKVLFGNLENLIECIHFWFKPDMWSLFDGEYGADWWGEFKLGLFVCGCLGAVFGEYHLLATSGLFDRLG